jgi:hypothetical protein
MTLQEAKSIARHLGLTLRKVRSGDYRVNFRDGNETTAYYTDCLEDAVNTAVEMARTRMTSFAINRACCLRIASLLPLLIAFLLRPGAVAAGFAADLGAAACDLIELLDSMKVEQ